MSPHDAFLEAILASPDDDTPRLVYADWLTDHDDPRGEFIAVQCELARTSAADARRPWLAARVRLLLDRHQDEWLGSLRPLLSGWVFRRGFLDEVAVPARVLAAPGRFTRPPTARRVEADLEGIDFRREEFEFFPESVAYENQLFPLAYSPGRLLVLAAARADDLDTLQKLQFIFNCDVALFPAPPGQVRAAIERHYAQLPHEPVPRYVAEFVDAAREWEIEPNEPPVTRLVGLIIREGLAVWAAEVRVEPRADHALVLYLTDGRLIERDRLPRRLAEAVAGRLRQMAGLDAAEEAQTGRFRVGPAGHVREIGVALTPTDLGPRIVLTF